MISVEIFIFNNKNINSSKQCFNCIFGHYQASDKNKKLAYIYIYIITQVILAFGLVLTYDLLEDRRIDDVIIKTFALCFLKMAESFENLADWENEDLEKSLAEAVDSYDKQEGKKNTFLRVLFSCLSK